MPSQHVAVNAAWFRLALLAYNLASAIKGLHFCASVETIRRVQRVWEVFQLPTPTGFSRRKSHYARIWVGMLVMQ